MKKHERVRVLRLPDVSFLRARGVPLYGLPRKMRCIFLAMTRKECCGGRVGSDE